MFSRHYNVNDVTKSVNVTLLSHETSGRRSLLGIISWPISCDLFNVEEFQAILELQTLFTTSIIPSKYAGSIKFYVKRLEKKLFLCVIADALE